MSVKPHITAKINRPALASYHGGQSASQNSRIGGWMPFGGSADTDILYDLPRLRPRSRDLVRNAPVATGIIGCNVDYVVGTGLSAQPSPNASVLGISDTQAKAWAEQTTQEWLLFSESVFCDAAARQNIYGLQALGLRSALESGDVFGVLVEREAPGSPYKTALQLIEADRVSNPKYKQDSTSLAAGIETDEWGRPVAAHIAREHPGSALRKSDVWDRVPFYGSRTGRQNVIHLFEHLRPGQTRGVPLIAPVIEHIKQIGNYAEAELSAAVVSAMFSVFLRMDPEAFSDLFDDDSRSALIDQAKKWDGKLEAGKVVNLLPGEEPVSSNPGRPNANFEAFFGAITTQIGMAVGIPREVLTNQFNSSYSASRAALLSAWRRFRGRREWLASYFCKPFYETWLTEAILIGRIQAPGFFADASIRAAWCRCLWVGDGPGSIDPEKEIRAARERIDAGISTIAAESLLYDGVPWDVKHKQRVVEESAREGDSLNKEKMQDKQPQKAQTHEDANVDG